MTLATSFSLLRLFRLLPVLSSSATLMFVLDEHIFLGTWADPSIRQSASAQLPNWWSLWGRRGRWVIILGYPINYTLAILNLLIARDQLGATGSGMWYGLGLAFSVAHMAYAPTALKLIAQIKNDVPKGKSTLTLARWLRMNWVRGLTTDLPAWMCFIVAALTAL